MATKQKFDEFLLTMLACPVTHSSLKLEGDFLVAETGGLKYEIRDGIPRLIADQAILPDGYETLDDFKAEFCKTPEASEEDAAEEEETE